MSFGFSSTFILALHCTNTHSWSSWVCRSHWKKISEIGNRKSGNPEIRKSEIGKAVSKLSKPSGFFFAADFFADFFFKKKNPQSYQFSPKEKTTVFYPGSSNLICWLLCTWKFFWGKNFPENYLGKNNFPVLGSSTWVRDLTFVTNTFQDEDHSRIE